jgi:hypothetical protein
MADVLIHNQQTTKFSSSPLPQQQVTSPRIVLQQSNNDISDSIEKEVKNILFS